MGRKCGFAKITICTCFINKSHNRQRLSGYFKTFQQGSDNGYRSYSRFGFTEPFSLNIPNNGTFQILFDRCFGGYGYHLSQHEVVFQNGIRYSISAFQPQPKMRISAWVFNKSSAFRLMSPCPE